MERYKYQILLILSLIALTSSLILSFSPASEVCVIGETGGGCSAVHNSHYNYTLGVQNSHYGVAIFLILSIMIYSQIKNPTKNKRNYIHTAIILGSVIALYFLYIQQFVLRDYCTYCLIVDASLLISLLIIAKYWKD